MMNKTVKLFGVLLIVGVLAGCVGPKRYQKDQAVILNELLAHGEYIKTLAIQQANFFGPKAEQVDARLDSLEKIARPVDKKKSKVKAAKLAEPCFDLPNGFLNGSKDSLKIQYDKTAALPRCVNLPVTTSGYYQVQFIAGAVPKE